MSSQGLPPSVLIAVAILFVTNLAPVKEYVYVHVGDTPNTFCEDVDAEVVTKDLNEAFTLFFEEKRFEDAREKYSAIIESEKKLEVLGQDKVQITRFNLASVCNNLGDYTCAIQHMSDLIFDQLDHIKSLNCSYMGHAYRLLGELLLIRKPNIPEFVNMMHEASEFYKSKIEVRRKVVIIAAHGAQYWEQIALKRKANSSALFNAGVLMYEIGRKHDAFKFLSRFRKRQTENIVERALGFFYLGLIYMDRNMYDHAWKALLKFVKLRPADYRGLMMLGRAFRDSGHPKRAIQMFRRAVDLEPKNWAAYIDAIEILKSTEQSPWGFINRGIHEGVINYADQIPRHFISGLKSQPWHDVDELIRAGTTAIDLLQQNYKLIKQEIQDALDAGCFFSNAFKNIVLSGSWWEIQLFDRGIRFDKSCNILPITAVTTERIPDLTTHVKGKTSVSVISPGTYVSSRAGDSNTRIRLNLGIQVPDKGAGIIVGNETRTWRTGKIIAYDDSFEHYFFNNGTSDLIILAADIWHPEMSHADRINSLDNMLEVDRYLYWMDHFNEDGKFQTPWERLSSGYSPTWTDVGGLIHLFKNDGTHMDDSFGVDMRKAKAGFESPRFPS